MASTYEPKYLPPKKGDKWDVSGLVGALGKIEEVRALDPRSAKGIKGLEGFLGPKINDFNAEQREAVANSYVKSMNNSLGEYVIGNLGDAVKYVGENAVLPIVANLPYTARKAEEGKDLSEKDKKYNAAVSAADKLKKMMENLKEKDGAGKELDAEFEGASDIAKAVWLNALGPEAFIQYRIEKTQKALFNAIREYGVVEYMKDAVAISDKADKEFGEKQKEIMDRQKSELEKKLKSGEVSEQDQAAIYDKYQVEIAELQKKYGPLAGSRKAILSGLGKEIPGLVSLVEGKYRKEEADKKAKEEAEKEEGKK